MRSKSVIVATLSLLLVQSAIAQPAPRPSAKQIALALEIMDATNAKANMTRMEGLLTPPILDMIRKANPDVNPGTFAAFQVALHEEFQADMGVLLKAIAGVYAKHFSEAELQGVLDFYRTPLGSKMLKEMPSVMQESVILGEAWGRQAGLQAAQRAIARLKGKGLKI